MRRFSPPLSPEELSWGSKLDPVEVAKLALKHCQLAPREKELLELLVKEGSIRKAARRLGGLHKRTSIRRVLRRVVKRLREEGVIE